MAEALADKADLRMLARKVSHDQFEMACDDLSRGLEHALGKLNVQVHKESVLDTIKVDPYTTEIWRYRLKKASKRIFICTNSRYKCS